MLYPYTLSKAQVVELDRALEALSSMGILDGDESRRVLHIRRVLKSVGETSPIGRDWVLVHFDEKDSKIIDKVMEGIW